MPYLTALVTCLASTSIGGGSDVSGWSYMDVGAFFVLSFWKISVIVSCLTTAIASLAGSGGGGGSTETGNVPQSIATGTLQYPAGSVMMIATLVTLRECSLISLYRC